MVRAKLKCIGKTERPKYGDPPTFICVEFAPVSPKMVQDPDGHYRPDPHDENSKFWAATPSGKLEIGCANPAAAAQFEVGKEYYIDVSPAT